jgi:hypothetical protein
MHKNAMKCKQNTKQMVHKQAWSIKNYRYVWDVSHLLPWFGSSTGGAAAATTDFEVRIVTLAVASCGKPLLGHKVISANLYYLYPEM